jgi:hypothetical protein
MVPVFLLALLVLGVAAPAAGQTRSLIDLEGGAGYAVGFGAEDSPPSLGTLTGGMTLWPARGNWGVILVRVPAMASRGATLRS